MLEPLSRAEGKAVIPPKGDRTNPRPYDKDLYTRQNRWRPPATRSESSRPVQAPVGRLLDVLGQDVVDCPWPQTCSGATRAWRQLPGPVTAKLCSLAISPKRRIFLDLAHLTEELFTFRPATVLQNAAESLAPGAADRSKLLTKRSFRQNPGRVKATSPAFPQMAISHSFAVTGPAWRSRHKPPITARAGEDSASRRPSGADRPDRARTASPATPVSARRAASARARPPSALPGQPGPAAAGAAAGRRPGP